VLVAAEKPMTVRQIFYRLVSFGAIAKSESEYKSTVCRLTLRLRDQGRLPWGWITDNTRWMRKPQSWSSLKDAFAQTARFYRRRVWDEMENYVEVWSEKDAISGVLYDVTQVWDVPLMVSRGFSSASFLHEAARTINSYEKPAYLYYFGELTP